MPLRIALISASRADAGIYMPLIRALEHEDIATTIQESQNWFFALERHPNWVVVLGDTWPMLDATIHAVKKNIPVAHIHGGDRSGGIDESIRHAITRFAHIHFPSITEHADRLARMGEEPWRIHVVGPLGIYAMPDSAFMSKEQVRAELRIPQSQASAIILQHPVLFQQAEAGQQMRETLEAVKGLDVMPVVIYPNADPGSEDMIRVIESYPYARFQNLPYLTFLSLLRSSACIVGNSSCGLVEAPLFGVPCVNVGTRQEGRDGGALTFIARHDRRDIETAMRWGMREIFNASRSSNPYAGYQGGVETIIRTLKETVVDERLLQKRLTI